MKKNIRLNKQIIKALSVGISASMLLQPVSAMAAELEGTTPEPVTDGAEDATEKTAYMNAEENAVDADEAVETAIEASEEAVDAVGEEAAEDVKDAAVSFNDAVEANKVVLADDCADETVSSGDAEEIIEAMEDTATLIDAIVVSGNNAAVSANDAVDTAEGAVTSAEQIAENANTVVDAAIESVSDNEQRLLDATSIPEANAIYDQIVADVSGADAAVSEAEEDIAELETAYNTAKTVYEEKNAAYEAAAQELAQALSAYQDLVDAGEDVTEDALNRLDELQANAERLHKEAEEAYNEYVNSSKGYLVIAEKEAAAQAIFEDGVSSNSQYNKIIDPLFEAVIRYYYVPDVLEGKSIKKIKWTRFNPNDELNYCTVVYVDAEGNEQTLLLNYRLADKNKSGGLVIFEKTAHYVYEGTEFTEAEKAALDAGEVIIRDGLAIVKNAAGEYSVYDDTKKTEVTLVEESATEAETVDIVENTVEVSYSIEDGKLVKTETADVITTTYTGETLDASAVTETSEDAARAAYVAALQEIIDNLAEGETIEVAGEEFKKGDIATDTGFVATSEDVVTGYAVSGTYNEKFTKTIDISGSVTTVLGKDLTEAAAELKYNVESRAALSEYVYADNLFNIANQQKYYLIESYNSGATIDSERKGLTKYTSSYSGSLTVTCAELASEERDFSVLLSLLTGSRDQQEKAIKEQLAKEGKIFIDLDGFDWRLFKGTVYYVDAVEKSEANIQAASEEEAKAMFLAGAPENAYNTTVSSVTANTEKRYGYDAISYIIKAATVNNCTISTAEWADILGNVATEYRNDKFDAGEILLAEYDYTDIKDYNTDNGSEYDLEGTDLVNNKTFRDKIDSAAKTAKMYQDLMQKTADAEEAIKTAKDKVDALQKEILSLAATGELNAVKKLEADLEAALKRLKEATDKRDELKEKLEEIEDELEDKINDLTPEVPGPGPTPGPGPDVTPTTPTDIADVITPVAPAPFVPAVVPAVVAEIPDDEVPQAEAPDAEIDDVTPVDVADIDDDQVALAAAPVNIGDDATPLASVPDEAQMSWWWLLIVLVLGATGAEMYRRHMAKKKAQGIADDTAK